MSRAATFRQADIQRAIKAAQAMGLTVSGYRIDANGTIEVLTGPQASEQRAPSALEAWRARRGRSAA